MGKYNSFLEYFRKNYYGSIEAELIEYLLKCSGKYKIKKKYITYNQVRVNSIDVTAIQFTKSNMDTVEFKVYLDSTFELINFTEEQVNIYQTENSFFTEMTGSFSKGFISKPDSEVIISDENPDKFTIDLVPVMPNEELDKYATQFLKYFCNEALTFPMPLNIDEMFLLKGMKYYFAPLESNVLGKTYFAEDRIKIYKDFYESNELEEIIAKPGTIVVNSDKALTRGPGSIRNTLIHEAVHWFFHRNYFELQQLLDNDKTNYVCYKADNEYANSDVFWMEQQARRLAPRILMPKNTAKIKLEEIIHDAEERKIQNNLTQVQFCEEIVRKFANFFKVSLFSAKIRIKELGFTLVDGVFNYVDDKKLQSFNVKEGVLDKYETFIIDDAALLKLREKNELLDIGLKTKKLIYINSMIVANNSQYVTVNLNLTNYALSNPEECCLTFKRLPTVNTIKDDNGIVRYLASSLTNADKVDLVSIEAINKLMGLADINFKHFNSHKKNIPDDIAGTITYHYEKCKENNLYTSIVALSEECDVSDLTLRKYMNGITVPDRLRVIKIGLAMSLSTPYLTDMLNKIDCRKVNINQENIIFDKIISLSDFRMNLVNVYEALCESHQEYYLDMSDKWLDFHGYPNNNKKDFI